MKSLTWANRITQAISVIAVLALCMQPIPASAEIKIDIEGVDEEITNNVRIFLSLERFRSNKDLTPETVERLHARAEREVKQALKPFGYYSPTVNSTVTKAENGRDYRVKLIIDPGSPVIVRTVTTSITGPGAEDESFKQLVAASPLKVGARLNHGAYDQLKGNLQRIAISTGYLDARYEQSALQVDLDTLSAVVVLQMQTGPRYRFGETTIEQDAIDPGLMERFVRHRRGDYFDAGALLRTQFALDDSQYFSDVEVQPGQRDPEKLTVPIAIHAKAFRKNTYSVGLGYGTDTRERGTLAWDNRRINRSGHRAHVEVTYANTEQTIATSYIIPVGDPALEKLSFNTKATQETLADLDVKTFEFTPGLTSVMGRWQRVISTGLTRTITKSAAERLTDTLLIPGISFAHLPRGYTGESLSLTPGLFVELTGSHSALGSDANFLRLHLQDEHVFDFYPRWHLLLRGELGVSMVANFSELPGPQRFFAGGDRSVRGFGFNELSPTQPAVDASGNPVLDEQGNQVFIKTGGRHLLVGSVEVIRDLPRNFGVALFVDGGNAFNKFGDSLEYAAGIGFRWRLPVVTVGIDVAQALSRSNIGPHFHLNISPQLR